MAEDNPATKAAKEQLEKDREATERSRAEFAERTKGKPTPTQEENDLAILGANLLEHEDDGSGPDPNVKAVSPAPGGTYQTRHTVAARPVPPRRAE